MNFNQILKEEKFVLNHEGAMVYKPSPEMELYTLVCTMALQPKFYEMPEKQIERVASLVASVNAEFVAKLAVYARREMHLRSVPLLLVVELAACTAVTTSLAAPLNRLLCVPMRLWNFLCVTSGEIPNPELKSWASCRTRFKLVCRLRSTSSMNTSLQSITVVISR